MDVPVNKKNVPVNKAFNLIGQYTSLPGGALDNHTFDLPINSKLSKIHSVFWSVSFLELIANTIIPVSNNVSQLVGLTIYYNAGGSLGNQFINFAWAGATVTIIDHTGFAIGMLYPGQYFFDSFVTSEDLNIAFSWHNLGLLQVQCDLSVIIEVEDISVL